MSDAADHLRCVMKKYDLSNSDVADLVMVSVKTVESWLASPDSRSFRRMPARHLLILDFQLVTHGYKKV